MRVIDTRMLEHEEKVVWYRPWMGCTYSFSSFVFDMIYKNPFDEGLQRVLFVYMVVGLCFLFFYH